MKQFKPGDIINAHALEQMRRFRAGVWKGGSGVAANHSGSRTRLVRQNAPRSGQPIWEAYGSKGGSYTGEPRYGQDITSLMRRINALESRSILWANRTTLSVPRGMVRDSAGDVYGFYQITPGTFGEIEVRKYDTDGNELASVSFISDNATSETFHGALDVDSSDNIYFTYLDSTSAGSTFHRGHIVVLDTDLNIVSDNSSTSWRIQLAQLGDAETHLWAVASALPSTLTSPNRRIIMKVTPAWSIASNIDMTGTTIGGSTLDQIFGVSDLGNGNLFCAASFSGPVTGYVMLLDSSGSVLDSVEIGSGISSTDGFHVRDDVAFIYDGSGVGGGVASARIAGFNSGLTPAFTHYFDDTLTTGIEVWKDLNRNQLVLSQAASTFLLNCPEPGTEFFKYPTTNLGDAISLGAPDSGATVPLNAGIDESEVALNYITDMRSVIEVIATAYINSGTGDQYNWINSDPDNLYFVTFGDAYDWTRDSAAMLSDNTTYDIDINEIDACVTQLEASDLAW